MSPDPPANHDHGLLDVVVVGCGFGGLYALHRLRTDGWNVRAIESAAGVGGVWFHNRYPGARCDVQSQAYAYTFDDDLRRGWRWSERFPSQKEILAYLDFVADRLDLRRDIMFNTRVERAQFNEEDRAWRLSTNTGQTVRARYVVMATGPLSVPKLPDIPGIDTFDGPVIHTSAWPEDVRGEFAGKRVAVLGTGSSGIQSIPAIAETAAHVTVLQRTPAFVLPAWHAPLTDADAESFDRRFSELKEALRTGRIFGSGDFAIGEEVPATVDYAEVRDDPERVRELLEARWRVGGIALMSTFADTMRNEEVNAVVADFVRAKIGQIVEDPGVARILTPTGYPIGSRRVCIGDGYYEAFNRPNVQLVDVRAEPIEEIVPEGVRTARATYEFDVLVCATGFDAFTGALTSIDIVGPDGDLRAAWKDGAVSYVGTSVAGFPNLFTLVGPGGPSALSNVVMSIEQHVEFIASLLSYAREHGDDCIDTDPQAQADWTRHVRDAVQGTLYLRGNGWFTGANIPGKAQVFVAYINGLGDFRQVCEEIADDNYRGFVFKRSPAAAA